MKFIKSLMPYIIIIIIVILIRTFIVTPVRVNGESMYPTLKGGEVMLLNKLGKIDRFKIVVIKLEQGDENIIKRVIGLPGEKVEIKNDSIYINDKKITDKYGYIDPVSAKNGYSVTMKALTLKDDEYFVLGDNRVISADSRIFGPIKASDIKGTANFIIYPFKSFGKVKLVQ